MGPLFRFAVLASLFCCSGHVAETAQPSECISCHAELTSTWQGSPHARAFSDEVFQLSWAESRDPWCTTCHLPANGVDCAACHGPNARTCADCHEFDLPIATGGPASGTLAQTTVSEWRSSGARQLGMDCVDCHGPHHASDGGDPTRVRRAVSAEVQRHGDTVSATISVAGIGHAFPTGDPFRMLQLVLCADLACALPVARVALERRLHHEPDGSWTVLADTRVPSPAVGLEASRTFTVVAPGARSWQLSLHLTDPRHASQLGRRAGYVVANGHVHRSELERP